MIFQNKPFSKLPIILLATLLLCCTDKTDKTIIVKQNQDSIAKENDSLRKVIDSLRAPKVTANDTLIRKTASGAGKHPITLQWISWDEPGEATLEPLADGSFQIAGSQANEEREYLNITGVIKRISDRKLEFDGTIETRINYNNGGKPCIKTGKQIFLRTGNRKYYRLENMENCEGGRLVDYVDIYPGTSGLF